MCWLTQHRSITCRCQVTRLGTEVAEHIRTLVVDDEAGIRFFIKQTLQLSGHEVTTAESGEQALRLLRNAQFDLVMLDLKLGSRVDGLKVLEALRWRWPDAAVIILTAHGSLESAMLAIREGVDRYVLKPVTPQELRTVVEATLEERREQRARAETQAKEQVVIEQGFFFIDVQKHKVMYDQTLLEMSNSDFDLLVYLMQHRQRVVPPVELVEAVRGYRPESTREARDIIKWYIYRLRQRIEPDPSSPRYILNVRGMGYRFQA